LGKKGYVVVVCVCFEVCVCGLVLFLLGLFYPFHLLNINIHISPTCSSKKDFSNHIF
jgi:hypothetical protein